MNLNTRTVKFFEILITLRSWRDGVTNYPSDQAWLDEWICSHTKEKYSMVTLEILEQVINQLEKDIALKPWYLRLRAYVTLPLTRLKTMLFYQKLSRVLEFPTYVSSQEFIVNLLTGLNELQQQFSIFSWRYWKLLFIKHQLNKELNQMQKSQTEGEIVQPIAMKDLEATFISTLEELQNYGAKQAPFDWRQMISKKTVTYLVSRISSVSKVTNFNLAEELSLNNEQNCKKFTDRITWKTLFDPDFKGFPGLLGRFNELKAQSPLPKERRLAYYRRLELCLKDCNDVFKNPAKLKPKIEKLLILLREGLLIGRDQKDIVWEIYHRLSKRLLALATVCQPTSDTNAMTIASNPSLILECVTNIKVALEEIQSYSKSRQSDKKSYQDNAVIVEEFLKTEGLIDKFKNYQQALELIENDLTITLVRVEVRKELIANINTIKVMLETFQKEIWILHNLALSPVRHSEAFNKSKEKIKSIVEKLHEVHTSYLSKHEAAIRYYYESTYVKTMMVATNCSPTNTEKSAKAEEITLPQPYAESVLYNLNAQEKQACRMLGIEPEGPVTWLMIRKAYKKSILNCHPDKHNFSAEEAHSLFQQAHSAYLLLKLLIEKNSIENAPGRDESSVNRQRDLFEMLNELNARIKECSEFFKRNREELNQEINRVSKDFDELVKVTVKEIEEKCQRMSSFLHSRLEEMKSEMQAQLEEMKSEMQAQLEEMKSEMQAQLEEIESETQAQLKEIESETQAQLKEIESETQAQSEEMKSKRRAQLDDINSRLDQLEKDEQNMSFKI